MFVKSRLLSIVHIGWEFELYRVAGCQVSLVPRNKTKCPLCRDCLGIDVNRRTVGIFGTVPYTVDVCY